MIMLAAVLHRDGEPPEPGLHLSPRGRLVNLGSSGGASASSGSVTLRSGGLSIPGYANNQPAAASAAGPAMHHPLLPRAHSPKLRSVSGSMVTSAIVMA